MLAYDRVVGSATEGNPMGVTEEKNAKDLPFLVAVRFEHGNEIFGFPTRAQRDGFAEGLKTKWPHLEYATSEMPGTEEKKDG